MNTTLRVNDTTHALSIDPRVTLLDELRDVLGLTRRKKNHRRLRVPERRVMTMLAADCPVDGESAPC